MNPLFYTVQAGANAQLRKSLDQPLLSGAVVYATGLAGLLLLILAGSQDGVSGIYIAIVNGSAGDVGVARQLRVGRV